jgi:hypothetical protein
LGTTGNFHMARMTRCPPGSNADPSRASSPTEARFERNADPVEDREPTREIAGNIGQAAQGTGEVSSTIGGVTCAPSRSAPLQSAVEQP